MNYAMKRFLELRWPSQWNFSTMSLPAPFRGWNDSDYWTGPSKKTRSPCHLPKIRVLQAISLNMIRNETTYCQEFKRACQPSFEFLTFKRLVSFHILIWIVQQKHRKLPLGEHAVSLRFMHELFGWFILQRLIVLLRARSYHLVFNWVDMNGQ